MERNLKTLCLSSIAASFWDKYMFENLYQVLIGVKYKLATKKFCEEVEELQLPDTLKADLKLVIIDFGKKKRFITYSMIYEGVSLAYANVVRWNDFGMVDLDKIKKEMKCMIGKPSAPKLYSTFCECFSSIWLKQPKAVYFQVNPDSHPLLVFEELTAMDGSGLVYYGKPRRDDTAGFVISLLHQSKFDNPNHLRLAHDSSDRAESKYDVYHFDYPDQNADVAHFVLNFLNEEQRQQVFKLGQSELIIENDEFREFFTNIFLHWPWQDEAFNYFTSKDEISEADCLVLKKIINYKRAQEMDILQPNHSFYRKVERFHKTVCRKCS